MTTQDQHQLTSPTRTTRPVAVITPQDGWTFAYLRELYAYRDLLVILAWRDVAVKYKQAALGIAWAILQPVLAMVIFTVIFGKLARLPSDGVPYPVFAYVALLPWQLFANTLTQSSTSLVSNANLLSKVYFPRLVIPIAAALAGLVDFLIAFALYVVLLFIFRMHIGWSLLALPLFVVFALFASLAVGIWLAALNVEYRDIQHVVPFLVQVWFYASPVVYSVTLLPKGLWRLVYGLNPMVGVIQGFRWALLGSAPPDGTMLVSLGMCLLLFMTGLWNFKRMERTFADVI